LVDARRELARRKVELRTLREDSQVAQARADVGTLRWYLEHAADTLGEGPLNHVSGWTTATPEQLRQALSASGIQAIIRSPRPPPQATPPVASSVNWWSRPFRPLVELLGPPGRQEVDPSGLLALVVPLLFGYMFPDVGHGLMLALLALALSWRWPQVRFLIPCGVSAMVFGLLAGDVFGLHDLIPPLWVAPLDDPLLVLAIPMGFGALLLLLGLVLAGVQARWRGEGRRWLWKEGAMPVLYGATLAGLLYPPAFWLAGLAGLQFLIASQAQAPAGNRLASLPGNIGDLVLGVFELGINTLSFLRVGAFALGHAALSHAVVTLAEGTGCIWGWWVVMVLGNLFALALEGLLVFVQTTRLVLFEFFTRFLRGEGRAFQPVAQPPVTGRRKNGGQFTHSNPHIPRP
jgi:V/A-type H+-transporting ATPase subunit I